MSLPGGPDLSREVPRKEETGLPGKGNSPAGFEEVNCQVGSGPRGKESQWPPGTESGQLARKRGLSSVPHGTGFNQQPSGLGGQPRAQGTQPWERSEGSL